MPKAHEIEAKFKEKYGDTIGGTGATYPQVTRCPTGYHLLDLAMGGGVPKGVCTVFYGPEASCKTTIALRTIAEHQRRWPDEATFFFDIESSYDPEWARGLGVDVDRLHVYRPDYAEQAVDMVEAALAAEDTGMVVLDSIAALTPTAEVEGDAEKAHVGAQARLVTKMVRKVTTQINMASKRGRMPAMLYINQVRTKIGVMYGNPEDMPGGNALKFQSGMTVRLWGKPSQDVNATKELPLFREMKAIIRKHKVRILGTHAEWRIAMVPTKGLEVGQADDFNTLKKLMQAHGLLAKDGSKGWVMDGGTYPNLDDVRAAILDDPVLADEIRDVLVDRIAKAATGQPAVGNIAEKTE